MFHFKWLDWVICCLTLLPALLTISLYVNIYLNMVSIFELKLTIFFSTGIFSHFLCFVFPSFLSIGSQTEEYGWIATECCYRPRYATSNTNTNPDVGGKLRAFALWAIPFALLHGIVTRWRIAKSQGMYKIVFWEKNCFFCHYFFFHSLNPRPSPIFFVSVKNGRNCSSTTA